MRSCLGGLALVAMVTACGGDDGATDAADTTTLDALFVTDTATGDVVADTASTDVVADTAAPDVVEDVVPTDTVVADTTELDSSPGFCAVGTTACQGYLQLKCVGPGVDYEVDKVCPLGCAPNADGGACAEACTPGAALGCVAGTARRCGADGVSALALSCLSGCSDDGWSCAPLTSSEREVFAADVSGVRVAAVGGDDVGRLAFAWQANVTGTPEPIRVLVTDADGNALSSSVALGGSDSVTFSQLVVRGAPDGAFVVLALDPSGATMWHLPVTDAGLPQPSSAPFAADLDLTFPSLVVWQDAIALYDLGPSGTAGREVVRRTQWALSGGAPVEATVDPTPLVRNDVIATRVSATEAHVFSAVSGQLRVTRSTPTAPGGDTLAFTAGEILFAGAAGASGRSVVAAFDFDADPEHAVYARFDGAALGDWGDVGPGRWFQAAATDGGVAIALLTAAGLDYAAASG
ncbi:MAG: hypothetical protein EP329_07990, partial [Deltaproteobacteria bacterium]